MTDNFDGRGPARGFQTSGRPSRGRRRRPTGFFGRARNSASDWVPVAGASFAVVAMMLFGGGVPGFGTTLLLAVAAVILLGCLTLNDGWAAFRSQPLLVGVGLLAVALIPLLQIVPLPPALWQALPGQELRLQTLELAGLGESWQPLSLTPLFTSGAAVIGVALLGLVALLLSLPPKSFRLVVWLVFLLIGLNIAIGLMQVASGGAALRFHRVAHHGALIGFFANKNHMGLVLAASLPIAAYLLGGRANAAGTRFWLGLYAGVALIALITTNSRAGLGFGVAALAVLGLFYLRGVKPLYVVIAIAVAAAAIALVTMTDAFAQVWSRFGNLDDDLRWQFVTDSWGMIGDYWLLGSGIGSFSTLYAVNEPLGRVMPAYVNQLHEDYLQLLLEAGLPGVIALAALAVGCGVSGVRTWIGVKSSRLTIACGGVILTLIAAHSLVDYPLRRPAVLPILAIGMVLVLRRDLPSSSGLLRRKHAA